MEPMRARIFFPLFLAAFMLVSGKTLILTAQSWIGADIREDVSSDHAVQYQPAVYLTSPAAAIQSTTSGGTVFINDSGLEPSQVLIQAGQVVTWVNQTGSTLRIVSGYPNRVFLPVLLHNTTSGSSLATALAPRELKSMAGWGGEVAAGGTYTHTFVEDSNYPYFIGNQPTWVGWVMVTSGPGRDLDEIVRGILFLVAEYQSSPLPGVCDPSISGPHWLYYQSDAWLDHGISIPYTEIHSFYPNYALVQRYSVLVRASDPAVSPHSFRHDVQGLPVFGLFENYTGTYTSTLYDSFTYSVTLTYTNVLRGELDSATIIKDYGNGETYQIELDNIERYLSHPLVEGYIATVYGGGYSGATQTVNDVHYDWFIRPVFCKQ